MEKFDKKDAFSIRGETSLILYILLPLSAHNTVSVGKSLSISH